MSLIPRSRIVSAITSTANYFYGVNSKNQTVAVAASDIVGASLATDTGYGGFWPNITSTAKINRMRDRLFVGGGAAFTGGMTATQGSFVNDDTVGNNWAPRDSAMFVAQDIGLMGITAYVSNEQQDFSVGRPTEAIGVSGFVMNKVANKTVWALYGDLQHEAGLASYGLEIACKNKSAGNPTDTPYSIGGGVYGIWLAGGGDDRVGGASTNPSNVALRVGKNAYGSNGWNKGIVFYEDGFTRDGNDEATTIEMAWKHKIVWRGTAGINGFSIQSDVATNGKNSSMVVGDDVIRFKGANGGFLSEFAHQASAVNYIQVINRATGSGPRITGKGSDSNVDLELAGTGTFGVRLMDSSGNTKIHCNSTGVGFYGTAPIAKPTGVAVSAAGIHAALVSLGLIAA